MLRTKFSAFTIPELLVAMLVSAIVLLAVLYGFQLISGLLVSSQKRSVATTNLVVLYSSLSNDFARADSIVLHSDTIVTYTDTLTIRYFIGNSKLIRIQPPRTDTLIDKAAIGTIEHHPLVSRLITSLSLTALVNGRSLKFSFEKEYPSISIFDAHSNLIEKQWQSKYQK